MRTASECAVVSTHAESWCPDATSPAGRGPHLPRGRGSSGGDGARPVGGRLLLTANMDHFIGFDPTQGRLECEAGTRIDDVLTLAHLRGWTLPVVPAYPEITVGGAIADDAHDCGHHLHGSFCRQVLGLELLRSNGQRIWLEPGGRSHQDLWRATAGGLGLTGLITRVRLQLVPGHGDRVLVETHRFASPAGLWALLDPPEAPWPQMIAWLDCASGRRRLGRGVLYRARPLPRALTAPEPSPLRDRATLSLRHPPFRAGRDRRWMRWIEELRYLAGADYSRAQPSLGQWLFSPVRSGAFALPPAPGRAGFLSYRVRLPVRTVREALPMILQKVARSGQNVAPATLQVLGPSTAAGYLSFAREGVALAFRIEVRDDSTLRLLQDLDEQVLEASGSVHAGQDQRMSRTVFRRSYPQWERFAAEVDPGFTSRFWQRMHP